MNQANITFLMLSSSLVMLMTPGIAFFYGGLINKKNVISVIIQCLISMSVTTLIWFFYGYSLCFSGDVYGVVGNLNKAFLYGIGTTSLHAINDNVPIYIFAVYQMMFAIIAPALMTGAFCERFRFGPYLIFLVIWSTFIYFPVVHMIWGGGILAKYGVLDFSGGIVVHLTSGVTALACVIFLGKRHTLNNKPYNLPLVAIGGSLLWFGWYGFNAGSELIANHISVLAFLNTNLSAAASALIWLLLDYFLTRKSRLSSFFIGSIAGLAAITPTDIFFGP